MCRDPLLFWINVWLHFDSSTLEREKEGVGRGDYKHKVWHRRKLDHLESFSIIKIVLQGTASCFFPSMKLLSDDGTAKMATTLHLMTLEVSLHQLALGTNWHPTVNQVSFSKQNKRLHICKILQVTNVFSAFSLLENQFRVLISHNYHRSMKIWWIQCSSEWEVVSGKICRSAKYSWFGVYSLKAFLITLSRNTNCLVVYYKFASLFLHITAKFYHLVSTSKSNAFSTSRRIPWDWSGQKCGRTSLEYLDPDFTKKKTDREYT